MTLEVLSLEDLSTALFLSELDARSLAFEALRSVVAGRVDEDGLETSLDDLLYPPFTEGFEEGLDVVALVFVDRVFRLVDGLLWRVDGVLAGLLLGLDMLLLELLCPIRCASSSTGARSRSRAGTAIFKSVLLTDFIGCVLILILRHYADQIRVCRRIKFKYLIGELRICVPILKSTLYH